jgi:hypothetical protein
VVVCNKAILDSVGHMAHASGAVARLPEPLAAALIAFFAMLSYHIGTWHVAYRAGARVAHQAMKYYVGNGPTLAAWLGWPSFLMAAPTAIASGLIMMSSLALLGVLQDLCVAFCRGVRQRMSDTDKEEETRFTERLRQLSERTGWPVFGWMAALQFEDWCEMSFDAITVTLVTLTSGAWTVLCACLCVFSVVWEILVHFSLRLHDMDPTLEYISLGFASAAFLVWAYNVTHTTYWTTPDAAPNIQKLSMRAHRAFEVLVCLAIFLSLNAVCIASHYLQQTAVERYSMTRNVWSQQQVGYIEWWAYAIHVLYTLAPWAVYGFCKYWLNGPVFRFVAKSIGCVLLFVLPAVMPDWFGFRPIVANTLTITGLL